MKNELTPPAIVRKATRCREELESEAVRLHGVYQQHGEGLLASGRELGEVLSELRDGCSAGEWFPLLEKLKIPQRTARWAVRKFRRPKEDNGNVAVTGQSQEEELTEFFAVDEEGDEEDDGAGTNWVDKRCEGVEWYTPPEIVGRVRDYFGGAIPLDPATAPHNPTGAERHFTAADDGLAQDWSGAGVFLNPPYGEAIADWCAKIHEEAGKGTPIVALLPCGARFSTEYWQDHILNDRLAALCFVRKRVKFIDRGGEAQDSNPYDSAIYGFNTDAPRFAEAFAPLGVVLPISGNASAGGGARPHVAHNSGEQEWYTPPEYLDAARKVLGGFDLDPASADKAQETVRAVRYHTRADDGLAHPWQGRVWLNPPYAPDLVKQFVGKLVSHFRAGEVSAAVVLVNNATETTWFAQCAEAASAACYPTGLVKFIDPDGNASGAPLQGQAVLYFGSQAEAFVEAFRSFGHVWRRA
jgi:ParB family chromosome partitioning protein